jgi:hypothetical protein
MKKNYLTPQTETIELQMQQVIAGSLKATQQIVNIDDGIGFADSGIADTEYDR